MLTLGLQANGQMCAMPLGCEGTQHDLGTPLVLEGAQVGTAVPAQGNIATRAWEGALGPATSRARPRTPSRAPERPPVRGVSPGSLALGEGGVPLWSRLVPPGELWPGDEHCPGETPKELLSAQVLCVSDCS